MAKDTNYFLQSEKYFFVGETNTQLEKKNLFSLVNFVLDSFKKYLV